MTAASLASPHDGVSLILKALEFAAQKHRDQRRKDKAASPYINHPIELANVLWQEGGVNDPVVIAAALLHDTIEDTETSWQELRGEFGDEIADIVVEVTDVQWLKKIVRKVESDPLAKFYKDEALTPVIDEDSEHMELYTQNEAARVAVERERRVAAKPVNGNGKALAAKRANGHQGNGHEDGHHQADVSQAGEHGEPISPLV